MIPRYSRPEMTRIWDPETRYRIWFEIESHAATAMANLGIIPKDAADVIWKKGSQARFEVARIDAIEQVTKHDVIAFLTHLAEIVGPEARFVHQGMTSSDVLDTTLNVQLVRAADILIADVERLLEALKLRAFEHRLTPTIGRSHGIHAEPTTFGLKLACAYAEFERARFNQPSSDQQLFVAGRGTVILILVWFSITVTFDDLRIFLAQVQSIEQLAACQHIERALAKCVHAFHRSGDVNITAHRIQLRKQATTIAQSLQRDPIEGHVLHAGAIGLERGVCRSKESRATGIGPRNMLGPFRQANIGRHRRIDRTKQLGNRCADRGATADALQLVLTPAG